MEGAANQHQVQEEQEVPIVLRRRRIREIVNPIPRLRLRANRYIHDYRDERLPCLCADEDCSEQSPLGFQHILEHPDFLGPEWMKIKEMEDTYDLRVKYPEIHKEVYRCMKQVKTWTNYALIPGDGLEGFVHILDQTMWNTDRVFVDDTLASKL